MKFLSSVFLFAISFFGICGEELDRMPNCSLISETEEINLSSDSSLYTFEFSNLNSMNNKLTYSIDGKTLTYEFGDDHILSIMSTPGKHKFAFYVSGYEEIFTRNLEIKAQYHNRYRVNLYRDRYRAPMKKPVIYLYPEEPTEVNFELTIYGEDAFYYPTYEDDWNFTANPDGKLNFGEKTYNYLFWEANTDTPVIDRNYGFFVQKDKVVSFLEDQLTLAGLSSQEQADFITFWAPQMVKHNNTYVHFLFNEDCEHYANLSITPKPDNIYRIYMIWEPAEEMWEVEPMHIEQIDRTGFSVLEWGGMELAPIDKTTSL